VRIVLSQRSKNESKHWRGLTRGERLQVLRWLSDHRWGEDLAQEVIQGLRDEMAHLRQALATQEQYAKRVEIENVKLRAIVTLYSDLKGYLIGTPSHPQENLVKALEGAVPELSLALSSAGGYALASIQPSFSSGPL